MTREEAIATIKELMIACAPYSKYYIVGDMAIKALEQEPKILETIDFAIDASNGDTNYFVGFRNGLRYAKSLIDGEEPQFESCAEQEPKTGHWIEHPETEYLMFYECSECGDKQCFCKSDIHRKHFCNNCGARMIVPQERSGKE